MVKINKIKHIFICTFLLLNNIEIIVEILVTLGKGAL